MILLILDRGATLKKNGITVWEFVGEGGGVRGDIVYRCVVG